MRKYQKAAVVMAMLGSVGFLGAGVGHAGEDGKFSLDNKQNQQCSADEVNFDAGGTVGAFAPTNAAGTQLIDQSERTSVNCTQLFTIGR
ncbi:hypothetical protein [Streptomyces sp. SD15]